MPTIPSLIAAASLIAADPAAVAVPEPSALAVAYARGNLALWFVGNAWTLAACGLILAGGLSVRLRSLADRASRFRYPRVAAFAALFFGLSAILDLPLDAYRGFWRQHAYGLSNQSAGLWLADWLKEQAFTIALATTMLALPFRIIRRSPRWWWAWLGALFVPFLAVSVLLKPVVFDPAFNAFGPMPDAALEAEILGLARRAGIDGGRVFEVDKSRDTKAMNAYVTGVLGTKRIVVWDTLRRGMSPAEVRFIVGHEIGHYALNHVAWGIAASSALTLVGLAIIRRIVLAAIRLRGARWGIVDPADVAALPLYIVAAQVVSLALTPVAMAYSRMAEHEADRFALEITRDNRSGATSFLKLMTGNLSVPTYDPITAVMRASHPALADRVRFCNDYHPWTDGRPGRYGGLFAPGRSGVEAQDGRVGAAVP